LKRDKTVQSIRKLDKIRKEDIITKVKEVKERSENIEAWSFTCVIIFVLFILNGILNGNINVSQGISFFDQISYFQVLSILLIPITT